LTHEHGAAHTTQRLVPYARTRCHGHVQLEYAHTHVSPAPQIRWPPPYLHLPAHRLARRSSVMYKLAMYCDAISTSPRPSALALRWPSDRDPSPTLLATRPASPHVGVRVDSEGSTHSTHHARNRQSRQLPPEPAQGERPPSPPSRLAQPARLLRGVQSLGLGRLERHRAAEARGGLLVSRIIVVAHGLRLRGRRCLRRCSYRLLRRDRRARSCSSATCDRLHRRRRLDCH